DALRPQRGDEARIRGAAAGAFLGRTTGTLRQHIARSGAQRAFRGVERFAAAVPADRVVEAVLAQDRFAFGLQLLRAPVRVVAQVEQQLQFPGNDVVGAGAGV